MLPLYSLWQIPPVHNLRSCRSGKNGCLCGMICWICSIFKLFFVSLSISVLCLPDIFTSRFCIVLYLMTKRGCPYSTAAPFSTRTSSIVPSKSLSISFISFIASTIPRTVPFSTLSPACTKGVPPSSGDA